MSTTPRRRSRGQTLAELGIVMPLLMMLLLVIFQVGFLIYQQYEAINLAREAANLMFRDKNLDHAESAIKAAQLTRDFNTDVKLILSVVEFGPPGGPNTDVPIILKRHVAGTLSGQSLLGDPPTAAYKDPTPDDASYSAVRPSTDPRIQARLPLPNDLDIKAGQSVNVAEIFLKRRDILPLSATNPIYAVAYF